MATARRRHYQKDNGSAQNKVEIDRNQAARGRFPAIDPHFLTCAAVMLLACQAERLA
jgi:hypothetical protein